MEDTIFTKIIRREAPAEILHEDEHVIVILNRFPKIEGETLVITKEQKSYVFDLEDPLYQHLMRVAKLMARALDATYPTLRTCMVLEGFDVPHVHAKLYPITEGTLDPHSGPMKSDEELRQVGDKIRANLPAELGL